MTSESDILFCRLLFEFAWFQYPSPLLKPTHQKCRRKGGSTFKCFGLSQWAGCIKCSLVAFSAKFDICLPQVASECTVGCDDQALAERIRGRVLCRREATKLIQSCRETQVVLLTLSTRAASDLSKLLSAPQRIVEELQLTEDLFQLTVQCQLKKMQQEKFKVKMLEDAAEAISKVARSVQDLQGVTVDKLAEVGVPLEVRVWLCRHNLIQGSKHNVEAEQSVEELSDIQKDTSDSRYVLMETAVQKVNKEIVDGFKQQSLLSTLSECRCKDHIEFGQYAASGIFMADHIPEIPDEHILANAALRDQGFVLFKGESLAIVVANSAVFKLKEKGNLFKAVCYEEGAARECLKSQEEILAGEDTDEESEEVGRTSDGSVPSATKRKEGKVRQIPLPEPDKNKFTRTPNIAAILMCVYDFLLTVRFETIFQKFIPNSEGFLTEDLGDGKRMQKKLGQLPGIEKKPEESKFSYFRRLAGREFLFLFLQRVCTLVCNWLPREFTIDRLWDDMYAGIVKSLAFAFGQHLHADKEPDRHGVGASVLINLSIWSQWITSLLRSSRNIEALLQYYRENYDLFATVYLAINSDIAIQTLSGKDLNNILGRAWQCHLDLYVRDNPSAFRPMKVADIELVPFMMKVFSLNHVHGGGAHPGKVPRRLRDYSGFNKKRQINTKQRWRYRYGKVHFRSGPKSQINFSFTWGYNCIKH